MTQHYLGKTLVPEIGQGTWNIETDPSAAVRALIRGIDLGMTHIDTAEMYGDGASECVVGRAIKDRRDDVFLVSKVLPSHGSYQGTLAACERSLRNLATDHLDVYLLHWPGSIPLEETFRAFVHLEKAGKIKAFGVSNFDVPDLEEAAALAGPGRLVCNQVLYHLRERAIEAKVLPWCRENKIAVVAYSPFGQHDFPEANSAGGKLLAEIGSAHGKTARQIALRFLVKSSDVLAIPKSGQVAHVEENAGALGFDLSEEEIQRIDSAFPMRAKAHLPML
ncbi:MAG TPA: aldo/keto reductase [Candidatus Methylacidiphilales bacterium]